MSSTTDCTLNPLCVAEGLGETIGGAINFARDPFGNVFKVLQDAARGLAADVLPALTEATLPDLTASWFLKAYAISFGLAILVAVLLLFPLFVGVARGAIGGSELVKALVFYFPMFMLGAMFGPMLGNLIVRAFHALSDQIIPWAIGGSAAEYAGRLTFLVDNVSPAALPGGVAIAATLMLLMVLGLFFVVLILVVQLVTLYFTGVMIPLSIVWIIDPRRRVFGLRLVGLWFGVLASHPLLFFLLGVAFNMMAVAAAPIGADNSPLQMLVTFLAATLAIFLAAFAPFLLLKFAPVIPAALGLSAGAGVPSLAAPGAPPIGPSRMSDADSRYERDAPDAGRSSAVRTSEGAGAAASIGAASLAGAAAEKAYSGAQSAAKGATDVMDEAHGGAGGRDAP